MRMLSKYHFVCGEQKIYDSQVMIKGGKASIAVNLLKPLNFVVDSIVMVGQIKIIFHALCI